MGVRHDEGFFSARDNLRLFWASDVPDSPPKAWVGVVHGYADHCGRYKGVIGHLAQEGFGVMAFDYRGHGQADGRRAFCEKFDDYLGDLDAFWERLRQAAGDKKVFLLMHSHGGLIGLRWAMARKPEGLAGWILSAPYLKLALTPPTTKVLGAKLVGAVIPWMPIKTELTSRDLTRDPELQKATDQDPLYLKIVTPRWFNESNRVQAEVAARAGAVVTWPTLLFAGAEDPVASTPAARAFFETVAAQDKTIKIYPGMLHECMNEVGKEEVWRDVAGWISAHL